MKLLKFLFFNFEILFKKKITLKINKSFDIPIEKKRRKQFNKQNNLIYHSIYFFEYIISAPLPGNPGDVDCK